MAISITCQCGQQFAANDKLAGKKVKCTKCGQLLAVPGGTGGSGSIHDLSLDDLDKLASAAPTLGDTAPTVEFQPPGAQGGAFGGFPAAGFQAAGFQTAGFQSAGQSAAAPKKKKGESNKKFIIAMSCLGGVAVLAVAAIIVMKMMGDDDKPDNSANNGANTPSPNPANVNPANVDPAGVNTPSGNTPTVTTPTAPPEIAALEPVSVPAGEQVLVDLQIRRNGHTGPMQIAVEGAPQGVTVQPGQIADGANSGQISIAADPKLGDAELKGDLKITVTAGQTKAEQTLAITVPRVMLPAFGPPPSIVLQPGGSATATITLERNGAAGPIALALEGLPQGVRGSITPLEDGKDQATINVSAAAGTADVTQNVRVSASISGRPVSIDVSLQVINQPFTVESFQVVWLKPGEQKDVNLPIKRSGYNGPITLTLENLPQGATAAEVNVPEGQNAATLTIVAAADAQEHVRTAKVVSSAGTLKRSDPIVVRVERKEAILPVEITNNPELPPQLKKGGFAGRMTVSSKQALLDLYGGTPESEEAVLRGLNWLVIHQQRDGSWPLKSYNLNITGCTCKATFENETVDSNCAGTAFGVLPLMGAGVGPNSSPKEPAVLATYQKNVDRAIRFIIRKQVKSGENAGQLDPNMYAHALGTMALCEAYSLSGNDSDLRVPTQLAVKYLISSQHIGGGWRYGPNQAGDLSATGWVFLAIRNGQLSGVPVVGLPLTKAERFVRNCACGPDDAKFSRYCYDPAGEPTPTLTMTAAGLLAQQYLGMKRENADLHNGCNFLMQPENLPPAAGNTLGRIYYYYYATQVLHHMGEEQFDHWNYLMREHLIRSQHKTGHEDGSWSADGADWGKQGGRLYATSLALMTLEVYYRHLPMYEAAAKPAME